MQQVQWMDQSFWKTRWDQGQIGFHRSSANPNLEKHWAAFSSWNGGQSGEGHILVPLCGKSLDLLWLEQQGHRVTGVEFVEKAALQYFEERGVEPERTVVVGSPCYGAGRTQILVGDFFKLSSSAFEEGALGAVDAVFDRAALVAVQPERREEYCAVLARVVPPGKGGLMITFEHDIGSGPPYSVPEVERLCGADFSLERVDSHDILEAESRFRERGATHMDEVVWYLRRK